MSSRRPEVALFRRNVRRLTTEPLLHDLEKEEQIRNLPALKRRKGRVELEGEWRAQEDGAVTAARPAFEHLHEACVALRASLEELGSLNVPELRGKVEAEAQRATTAGLHAQSAIEALDRRDLSDAGGAIQEAVRELHVLGGPLVVTLNQTLAQAAIPREKREALRANLERRRLAKIEVEATRDDPVAGLHAAARSHELAAEGYALAADLLRGQVRAAPSDTTKVGRDGGVRIIPPQELESFDDVGGLEDVKAQLRATVGTILERPDEAARYSIVHNGILFHGPPGTGKTLLSRALAGEYGLRYMRFSPASIASGYIHEAATNLVRMFELAKANTPCLLFLDEVDTIASARDDQPSADHREVVTQLMNCLEEYRSVPGLVIAAATNNLDRLDAGLREGRFDARILVPLPDATARKAVFRVQLDRRSDAVEWAGIDLDAAAELTSGRNAAAIESFVTLAAQNALKEARPVQQQDLLDAIDIRAGRERVSLEDPVHWEDVVLAEETREQLMEILNVFSHPELARSMGVKAPAGLLLHGPPGTGKTTVAKAMATEVKASFYEQSAADLLSKWAGESEERVAKLFARARANRPSIIFVDEIDGLLRRRGGDAASGWEERVVGQFLRELDGLTEAEGVLLVGATNRLDIVDPAIQGRRLTPIEVALPDGSGRLELLTVLCRDMALDEDVDRRRLATLTEGFSGADLKRLRDLAGMKALNRAASGGPASVTMADFRAALDTQRGRASLVDS